MLKHHLPVLLLIGTSLAGATDGVRPQPVGSVVDGHGRQDGVFMALPGQGMPSTGSFRGGLGRTDVAIDSTLAGYPPQDERPVELRMDVYPHPVRGVATLRMCLEPSDAQRSVRVQILTMAGTVVGDVYDDVPAAERLEIPLPAASTAALPAGMYFLVVHTASSRKVLSIIVA